MKNFLTILFLIPHYLGWLAGVIIRPIYVGFMTGFLHLELKEYNRILQEAIGNTNTTTNSNQE